MTSDPVLRLPAYPSTATRKSLSPSQLATLNQTISTSLIAIISLPPSKRDSASTRTYISTFAKDSAFQTLQALIWESDTRPPSKEETLVRKRTLALAEKIALVKDGLDLQVLVDLCIVYASRNSKTMKNVFKAALESTLSLLKSTETELVPALTHLLSDQPVQGLYALRKSTFCVLSFLQCAPKEVLRLFSCNKPFILALATAYDLGLASIAQSYGGLWLIRNAASETNPTPADDWEPIWVQTKVSIMDSFHLLFSTLLDDLSSSKGSQLAFEVEQTFDVVFALLEVPSSSNSGNSIEPTPFLNRSLLADYQASYDLGRTLANALKGAEERDARLDILESMLGNLKGQNGTDEGRKGKGKDAGALRILLRSSGIQPGIDSRGTRSSQALVSSSKPIPTPSPPPSIPEDAKGKGKAVAPAPPKEDPDLDLKTVQILDVLPDLSPLYIRALLAHERYSGDVERVLGALLEGSAISEEALARDAGSKERAESVGCMDGYTEERVEHRQHEEEDVSRYVRERRNVFDDEMDLRRVTIGKKKGNVTLQDRSYIEQMKADILRRAEAIDAEEEEEEAFDPYGEPLPAASKDKEKAKATIVTSLDDDLDLEEAPRVKVLDGEETADDEDEEEEGDEEEESEPVKAGPETILELAYIRDPKLFDRDAATRRGKPRAELKKETGWSDEQIEGWRIMLERNPNKDRILEKHEFRGNQPAIPPPSQSGGRGRGRGGRGDGRGRGGGRGRGSGGAPGSSGDSARERAWKDKNKASRGNHNRKRGHDKKLARAGGPS